MSIKITFCTCEFGGYDLCYYCGGSGVIMGGQKVKRRVKKAVEANKLSVSEHLFIQRKNSDIQIWMTIDQCTKRAELIEYVKFLKQRCGQWQKYFEIDLSPLKKEMKKHIINLTRKIESLEKEIKYMPIKKK